MNSPEPAGNSRSDSPIRLVVADDDEIILEAFTTLFNREPGIKLIAAVDSGVEVMQVLAEHQVDLALLDVEMPWMNGIETAERIRRDYPNVVVVMCTNFEHEGSFERSLAVGAKSFLTKDMPFDALVYGIKRAYRGGHVFGDRPTEILLEYFNRNAKQEELELRQKVEALPDYLQQVLNELMLGQPNKVIADKLALSDSSVRNYVSQLLEKTGCKNRAELAARASRSGYRIPADRV
ncbi:MAG: response regulator transcription factor [Scrofimicrobium sp.]